MFVGVESCDKICHMTVHTRKPRRGAGLRTDPAAGPVKSTDAEEVKPQITQITQKEEIFCHRGTETQRSNHR